MSPQRIQRKRIRGWRMPPGAVDVTRPGRWGNPYRVHTVSTRVHHVMRDQSVVATFTSKDQARAEAVQRLRMLLAEHRAPWGPQDIRDALAGRDLMCWCPIGAPCHGDLLLGIANSEATP